MGIRSLWKKPFNPEDNDELYLYFCADCGKANENCYCSRPEPVFLYQLFHPPEHQLLKCLTQQIVRYVEIQTNSAPALLSTKNIQGLPELVLQNNWGNSQEKETYLFPPDGIKQLQYYNISMFLHNSKEDSWSPKLGHQFGMQLLMRP